MRAMFHIDIGLIFSKYKLMLFLFAPSSFHYHECHSDVLNMYPISRDSRIRSLLTAIDCHIPPR